MTETILSAIAIIVAALIAALLGFYGNLKIKVLEIENQAERARAEQRLRYYLPLLRLCYTLDRRIGHILAVLDTDWLARGHLEKIHDGEGFAVDPKIRGYFIVSSIYIFACFFGWSEAIKQGVDRTIPFSRRSLSLTIKYKIYNLLNIGEKRDIFVFDPDISMVGKLFQYKELFDDYLEATLNTDPVDESGLHKQFQYSIGELMLEDDDDDLRCKSFREFFDSYCTDPKFRFWFVPLENLFSDLCGFEPEKTLEVQVSLKNDIRPLRLLAIRYWVRVLMKNMATQLDLETLPPEDALIGVSDSLKKSIQSVRLHELESYLLGVKIDHA